MSLKKIKAAPVLLSLLLMFSSGTGCNCGNSNTDAGSNNGTVNSPENISVNGAAFADQKLKVTFVELGSENCMPCRMMKPVMEKVEKQYPDQVKVIFHDVWTEKGKAAGYKFAVRVIPTQVFLDENGEEYFRHEGFFSFEEISKILKQKGVN